MKFVQASRERRISKSFKIECLSYFGKLSLEKSHSNNSFNSLWRWMLFVITGPNITKRFMVILRRQSLPYKIFNRRLLAGSHWARMRTNMEWNISWCLRILLHRVMSSSWSKTDIKLKKKSSTKKQKNKPEFCLLIVLNFENDMKCCKHWLYDHSLAYLLFLQVIRPRQFLEEFLVERTNTSTYIFSTSV